MNVIWCSKQTMLPSVIRDHGRLRTALKFTSVALLLTVIGLLPEWTTVPFESPKPAVSMDTRDAVLVWMCTTVPAVVACGLIATYAPWTSVAVVLVALCATAVPMVLAVTLARTRNAHPAFDASIVEFGFALMLLCAISRASPEPWCTAATLMFCPFIARNMYDMLWNFQFADYAPQRQLARDKGW